MMDTDMELFCVLIVVVVTQLYRLVRPHREGKGGCHAAGPTCAGVGRECQLEEKAACRRNCKRVRSEM